MNLIPFVEIAHTYGLEPQEQGIYKVYSQFYDQEMELHEYYCSNPNCHCREANLMFYESGDLQASDLLFQFEVDLNSLKIRRDRISPKDQEWMTMADQLPSCGIHVVSSF